MTPDQYHLCKIAEECNEVAQRALKAQQFGLGETQPGQGLNNLERLVDEFHDLFVTFDNFLSAVDRGMRTTPTKHFTDIRLTKMRKFLQLSQRLDQVSPETQI
jgi:hypothetical protein